MFFTFKSNSCDLHTLSWGTGVDTDMDGLVCGVSCEVSFTIPDKQVAHTRRNADMIECMARLQHMVKIRGTILLFYVMQEHKYNINHPLFAGQTIVHHTLSYGTPSSWEWSELMISSVLTLVLFLSP